MKKFPPQKLVYQNGHRYLALCAPEIGHVTALVEAISETSASLNKFMPWSHEEQTTDRQLDRLSRIIGAYWQKVDMSFHGFNKEGLFVCGSGLHDRVALNPKGREIGYWVRQRFQGQGYATLATKILTVFAFDELACDRVQISHNVENNASRRVIEKCGFVREGLVRNLEAAREQSLIDKGLTPSRNNVAYALLPEDLTQQDWVKEIRENLSYVYL